MKATLGCGTVWLCAVLFTAGAATHSAGLSAPEQAALERISADSLRGNLSFLASDALEGRGTPSRGLDVAAEFIAAQFRKAGLEPIGKDGSYFQTAKLIRVTPSMEGFQLTLRDGGDELELPAGDVRVRSVAAVNFREAGVVRLPEAGEGGGVPAIRGKVVAGGMRRYGTEAALFKLQAERPALILLIGRSRERAEESWLEERDAANAPVIRVTSEAVADALREHRELRVSVHVAAPRTEAVVARNVGGILRGSDAVLREQYVLVTAHYDHLGLLPEGSPDRVYNGANDNGSGTVSVIEIAAALATLPVHPRRSVMFLALYGEEEGLLGAFYYTRHPVEPLRDTVADINLEQLGRTDEQSGPQVGSFSFTGPSYSNLPALMEDAAKQEGVKVYAKRGADAYFDRSDNYAFALAGVVAHTIVVAYEFPDYHAAGDEWQKIDYPNMAKVDRGVAAGVLGIANRAERPGWSDAKEAAVYRGSRK